MRRSLCVSVLLFFASLSATSLAQAQSADRLPKRDYELLHAAASGDTMAIRRLAPRGARLEVRDGQYGFTPLMWASWRANIGTMRELIKRGAKVNATTSFANPANVVLRPGDGSMPIPNMSFFVRNSGVTPLLLAASSGSGRAVQELLKQGAHVQARTVSGETPLSAAIFADSLPSVKSLLAKGANPNETITFPFEANAALFLAIMRGNEDIVKELLRAGANVTKPLKIFGNYENLALRSGKPGIAILIDQARQQQLKANTKRASQLATQSGKNSVPQRETVNIINADGSVQVYR